MDRIDFRERTKRFAIWILKFYAKLPSSPAIQILGRQLVRSGTSVAANFREACRARSKPEFISKLGICVQEADETQLWLELLHEGCDISSPRLDRLLAEANEIIAILVTMSKNSKT